MPNSLVWVDIPVLDLDRAMSFYQAVLAEPVTLDGGPGFQFGLLAHVNEGISGCLFVGGEENQPSKVGPLIYLNADGRLADAVVQVEANGGTVLVKPHQIGPHGHRAVILDTEGNRIALHSQTF